MWIILIIAVWFLVTFDDLGSTNKMSFTSIVNYMVVEVILFYVQHITQKSLLLRPVLLKSN